jgi:hypothetical protein
MPMNKGGEIGQLALIVRQPIMSILKTDTAAIAADNVEAAAIGLLICINRKGQNTDVNV